MIGATFLPWSAGFPPKTKPLSLPKHSTNTFLLRWAVFPLQTRQDQEGDWVISRSLQVATLASLFTLLAKAPCSWDDGPMTSASCEHRLEKMMTGFQFSI
jgi:hypothetical protein